MRQEERQDVPDEGVRPEWLELQMEIRDRLEALIERQNGLSELQMEEEVRAINLKVSQYNQSVPSPSLLKFPLTHYKVEEYLVKWT